MTYPPTPTPAPQADWPSARPAPRGTDLVTNADLQGNVLAGFFKDHQTLLLLAFHDIQTAQGWLAQLTPRLATNAAVADFNQRFSAARRAGSRDPDDLFAVWSNLSLTADGFRLLAAPSMEALSARNDLEAALSTWLGGAVAAAQNIGDTGGSAPANWLFGNSETIHAVLCVAADRPADLAVELQRQRDAAAAHQVTIVFEQDGATLPGPAAGHEHFGFKDGISQPGVTGFDPPDPNDPTSVERKPGTDLIAAGEFVLGYPRQGRDAVRAPLWMFDGSFLVLRRLAQDVPGFWSSVEQQFRTLGTTVVSDPATGVPSADSLGARLFGRWRSGTPTDHSPTIDLRSGKDPGDDNNFDFSGDPSGDKTPLGAHIRKVYPRKGAPTVVPEEAAEQHRILRRGIPFGLAFEPGAGRGHGVDAERGLVFQCYQADLSEQFIFLERAWVNTPGFPAPDTGNDAVIGNESDFDLPAGGAISKLHFAQFVTTEGSLFAFTPSLPTLKLLAAGDPLSFS